MFGADKKKFATDLTVENNIGCPNENIEYFIGVYIAQLAILIKKRVVSPVAISKHCLLLIDTMGNAKQDEVN